MDNNNCMDKMLSNSLGVCRQVIATAERPSIDYLQLITSIERPPAVSNYELCIMNYELN